MGKGRNIRTPKKNPIAGIFILIFLGMLTPSVMIFLL